MGIMKKRSYFEEFNVEHGSDNVSEYFLIKDEDQIIGSVYYAPVPNGDGTAIFYLGYGDKLHPYENTKEIEELKSKYPRLSVEIFKWIRKNLPQPYYAAFANEELKRALRAEPTGMRSVDITTGEPVDIHIIRRSSERFIMSSNEKVDRVKEALKEKDDEEYNNAMIDLWESISPGMGKQYIEKYHSPPKSEKELKEWANEELKKADPTGTKTMDKPEQRKKKSSVDLTPPEGVRAAARRGIKYHSEGKAGKGFESATLTRARKIAEGKELTPEHVKRMHSFFERHAGGRSEKAGKGEVTPWDVAWLAWGGNAGRSWAASKVKEMERSKESSKKKRGFMFSPQRIKDAVDNKNFKEAERLLEEYRMTLDGSRNPKEINAVLKSIKNLKEYIQRNKEAKSKCNCWDGYKRVPGTKPCAPGSCEKCDNHRKKKKKS